ncbi:endonuclease NucS [Microbacterium oxydans]|uniref:endonuclease NucS n=1 Tax=Microbacterium oxydans TaxID=82380 RepID=UPI00226B17A7|nr:endonuclease NucS [Microbacterium oxydans]WAA65593.1 endonuclease NucS [Microbacterium oxydans]
MSTNDTSSQPDPASQKSSRRRRDGGRRSGAPRAAHALPLWRLAGDGLVPVLPQPFALETNLEDLIESTPELVGERVLIIGRQVKTPFGRVLDLLGLREDGSTKTMELKRDRAKDLEVGQVISYGAWVDGLDRASLEAVFEEYILERNQRLRREATVAPSLAQAYAEYFGKPMPAVLNQTQTMSLVARQIDAATLQAVKFLREKDLPISLYVVGASRHRGETFVTASEWIDLGPKQKQISVRAQLEELHLATVAAVEHSTSQLLSHIHKQRPERSRYDGPFFTKGSHGDILCFAQLFMPRFTTSFVPYPLLDALYDWWINEQASVGVERLKPTHGFAHQLRNAVSMVGGWRKDRKYWDEDPSLEHERLRLLVGGWPLPAPGQLLSGYARM